MRARVNVCNFSFFTLPPFFACVWKYLWLRMNTNTIRICEQTFHIYLFCFAFLRAPNRWPRQCGIRYFDDCFFRSIGFTAHTYIWRTRNKWKQNNRILVNAVQSKFVCVFDEHRARFDLQMHVFNTRMIHEEIFSASLALAVTACTVYLFMSRKQTRFRQKKRKPKRKKNKAKTYKQQ